MAGHIFGQVFIFLYVQINQTFFAYKCCLLITFANSLDTDQDSNDLTLMVFLKDFFEKVDFEKISADNKKGMQNYLVVISSQSVKRGKSQWMREGV